MPNIIQVKRSTTNATPASLTAGELAYSFLSTSNSLFVGNTSAGGPIRIGGGQYAWLYQANTGTPGALTANAVVITNGNSFVTNWKTNALTVGVDGATVSITNIATSANLTQLGNAAGGSNTELVSSWAIKTYVDSRPNLLPNTFIPFGANNFANGSVNTFTFDSTNLILSIGNTTVNTQISQTAITTTASIASGNVNVTGTANASVGINVGANVNVTTAQLTINDITTATFNANAGVSNTTEIVTTTSAHGFVNNQVVTYIVSTGNTTVVGLANGTPYFVVNAASGSSTLQLSATSGGAAINLTAGLNETGHSLIRVNSNTVANTTALNIGTALGNVAITAGSIRVGNTTTGTINAFALNISGVTATGNTTVTGFVNASSYGTFGGQVNATSFNSTGTTTSTFANNVTITGVANVVTLNSTGGAVSTFAANVTVTGTANISAGINVGANIVLSTTSVSIGNTTVNTQITAGTIKLNGSDIVIGNTATNTSITGTSVTIGGTTSITNTLSSGNTTHTGFVNVSSYGTFGGVVNATSFNSTGTATSTFANNVTVTGVTNTVSFNQTGATLSTFANSVTVTGVTNTVSFNQTGATTSTFANNVTVTGVTNTTTLNVGGVMASGNATHTGFVNASSYGTFGGQVNATSFNSTGTATSTFANNVTVTGVVNATSMNTGDLQVSGNLTVTGTLTTVSANNLIVTDSLIQLSSNNNLTDVLDIGLFGNYGTNTANTADHRHTGLYRDRSDGVWKLFTNLLPAPTTTVDSTNATYTIATLKSHLSAGGATAAGFIANATTIAVTANSTLNVAFVANTLTLTTALAGTSGGTGLNTYTSQDLLVANTTNGFSKLGVGSDGFVLQVTSSAVAWGSLDGGSF